MSTLRARYTLHQLEVLVAVSETGSISAAADRLHMSASAVSASVTGLERLLGHVLVVRRPAKGARLTVEGGNVLRRAREILRQASDLQSAVGPGGEVSGPLTLGCFPSLAPTVLPRLVSTFLAANPKVDFDLREGDQSRLDSWLSAGTVDLAVVHAVDCPAPWHMTTIGSAQMMLVVSGDHPLAGESGPVDLARVAAEPMVLLDLSPSAERMMAVCGRAGFTPTIGYRTPGYETVRSFVARGLGWTLMLQRPVGDMSYEGFPLVYKEIARPAQDPVPIALAHMSQATLSRAAQALSVHAGAMAASPVGLS